MLNDLRTRLLSEGYSPRSEYQVWCRAPSHSTVISGKIDCFVVTDQELRAYDCKTGQERSHDKLQLMIYFYALANEQSFPGKTRRGFLLYKDLTQELAELPDNFESNLDYFVDLLEDRNPLPRDPGDSCRFCNISSWDCPDREARTVIGN